MPEMIGEQPRGMEIPDIVDRFFTSSAGHHRLKDGVLWGKI
jgi:hypothetical protein